MAGDGARLGALVLVVVADGRELLRVGLYGRQDEGRKDGGEERGAVYVRVGGERDDERERQAEAEVVGPARLDVADASLDVPAHVAQLVLERVERVEKGQVDVTEEPVNPLDGDELRHEPVDERRLHEEDELHDAAEYVVGYDLSGRELVIELRLAVLLRVGDVGDLLVHEQVEDLAEHEYGQYPDEGEEERDERIEYVRDEAVVVVAEELIDDAVEDGHEHVVEGDDAREQEDAVEYAALDEALIELLAFGHGHRRRLAAGCRR